MNQTITKTDELVHDLASIPGLKTKFLDALRSGQYKQGTYVLRDDVNRYCALGVLYDVIGDSRINKHLGMPASVFNMIAELNDGGTSFPVLADLLEGVLGEDFQSITL